MDIYLGEKMKVSVVMAVYNGEKFLKEAIDSVLAQTFENFEFIIVNDGSTDQTSAILSEFDDDRIIIINQENVGLSKSLNKAIYLAKGKYIARLDADDKCKPTRLEKQFSFLENNADVLLIGSNVDVITANDEFLYETRLISEVKDYTVFEKFVPFIHSSVMYRKSAFIEVGGYNENIIHHFEDKLMWAKMFKLGKLKNLAESLTIYRLTPNSISNKSKKVYQLQQKISNAIMRQLPIDESYYKRFLTKSNISPQKKLFLYYYKISKIYLVAHKNREKGMAYLKLALKQYPFNFKALKLLVYTLCCVK